jgi:GNAT superfamily N-acetyltransferase
MTAGYAQAVRNRQAWAAVEDGEIAGFAILIARPGYLLLDNVAVLPAAQGHGIGARGCLPWPKTTPATSVSARSGSTPTKPPREPRLPRPARVYLDPPGRARRLSPGVPP